MAATAKESKAAGAKATKVAAKPKAAATSKAAKESTATTPKKGRKRTADAIEEAAPVKLDEPVKQAKKDVAKKTKAKAKKEEQEEATAASADVAVEAAPPKAKKAKTSKSTETAKAEEKETKAAKTTKKAAPKKAAEASETKPKKAAKAKDTAATGASSDGAAKPRKRKVPTIDEAETKAKSAVATAAKKQKISEETAEEGQSLLGLVGASLKDVSKRMSGLFSVLSGAEEPTANGTTTTAPKKKAPAASKKSSSAKAKATPTGEDTADGSHEGALELADSDFDVQDNDPAAEFLRGFESSDGEAASGDEGFTPGKPLPKLPSSKALAKKLKGVSSKGEPGVVYIGRIPHGFHEREMRAYFTQFGPVDHVRLSRSKKTGASKHYAFLQFASADVARIAAETMNNYLMFGHILKCHVVPPAQVHPSLWIGADRHFKAIPWNKIEGRKIAQPKGRTEWQDRIDAETKRRTSKAKKLQAIGYEFEAPALKDVSAVPARAKVPVEQSTSVVTTASDSKVISAHQTEVSTIAATEDTQKALPEPLDAVVDAAQAAVDAAVTAAPKAAKRAKRTVKAKA